MKTFFINILLLILCVQIYGQITVDTQLSVKDSAIIVTLQNASDYKMVLVNKVFLENWQGSEMKFLFVDMKGDTIRRIQFVYGDSKFVGYQPKEKKRMNYFIFDKIDFEKYSSIKVIHNIDYYIRKDTTVKIVTDTPANYREEVIFNVRKILQRCNGTKTE